MFLEIVSAVAFVIIIVLIVLLASHKSPRESPFQMVQFGATKAQQNALGNGMAYGEQVVFAKPFPSRPFIIVSSVEPSTQMSASVESVTNMGFHLVWTNFTDHPYQGDIIANWFAFV